MPPGAARRRWPVRAAAGLVATGLLAAGALVALSGGDAAPAGQGPAAAGGHPLRGGATLYVPPDGDAARQAQIWERAGRTADAALMRALARVPQAIRLAGGGPDEVRRTVRDTMARAARQDAVPVFVTDFVPMRDCHNGGAASPEAYRAWIDGVADGIGDGRAVVALEPAGLSRAPGTPECPQGGPQALRQRYADLGYAVNRLGGLARTAVYLDGGLAGWPSLEASAERLAAAGVAGADGFYLNVNGHRPTPESVAWGIRLAKCVHLRLSGASGCPEDALRRGARRRGRPAPLRGRLEPERHRRVATAAGAVRRPAGVVQPARPRRGRPPGPPPAPATCWWTRCCGSTTPAGPRCAAPAVRRARRTRCTGWSPRTPASGGPSSPWSGRERRTAAHRVTAAPVAARARRSQPADQEDHRGPEEEDGQHDEGRHLELAQRVRGPDRVRGTGGAFRLPRRTGHRTAGAGIAGIADGP